MNYKKIYDKLIYRSKNRTLPKELYTEKHHIIPVCLEGNDSKDNLSILTSREHFVAHQLLVKIYPNKVSLIYSLRLLTAKSNGQIRNNKEYSWIKSKISSVVSNQMANNTYTLGLKHSEYSKNKMSDARTGNKNAIGNKNWLGRKHKEETKLKISKSKTGKKANDETKLKMSKQRIGNKYSVGNKNTTGTKWLNKNGENKMIKKDQIQDFLNDGWNLGQIKKVAS